MHGTVFLHKHRARTTRLTAASRLKQYVFAEVSLVTIVEYALFRFASCKFPHNRLGFAAIFRSREEEQRATKVSKVTGAQKL